MQTTSAYVAAGTALGVVAFVSLTLPRMSPDDNPGVVLGVGWTFGVAAMIGVVFGAIGILFAVGSLLRKEPGTLAIWALLLNLPVPILGLMILVRKF